LVHQFADQDFIVKPRAKEKKKKKQGNTLTEKICPKNKGRCSAISIAFDFKVS